MGFLNTNPATSVEPQAYDIFADGSQHCERVYTKQQLEEALDFWISCCDVSVEAVPCRHV